MSRTLRTGKEFSPYSIITTNFSVQERLEEVYRSRGEENEWGVESDREDFGDESDEQANAPLNHREDMDQATLAHATEEKPRKPGRGNRPCKVRKRLKKREERSVMRAKTQEEEVASGRQRTKVVARRHIKYGIASKLVSTFNLETPHVTTTKWTGLRLNNDQPGGNSLSDFLSHRFKLVDWDGYSPQVIVDSWGHVIAVLGGMPRDDNDGGRPTYGKWGQVAREASQLMCGLRKKNKFTDEQRVHRRGDFIAIDYGISFGGGQKVAAIFTTLFIRLTSIVSHVLKS